MRRKETVADMEDDVQGYEEEDDVIVIKKSWLVTAVVALAAFALGGAVGFFAFSYPYSRGASDTAAAAIGQRAGVAAQQPQVQPTAPPAYIEGVSADDDPVLGPDDAPVTIVEFSDFQCPFCKRFVDQTFAQLQQEYGDQIRIVYRDFPLTQIHPDAQRSAEAAECADEQGKFWEMHDAMFASQALGLGVEQLAGYAEDIDLDVDEFAECLDSGKYTDEVEKDLQDGSRYGVTGTPTFFINGYRLVGAQPFEAFKALIDRELEAQ